MALRKVIDTDTKRTPVRSTDLELNSHLHEELERMRRLFAAAQEEIALLTDERDEVVAAIKRWNTSDPSERDELQFDMDTMEWRSEMKLLRSENNRLQRENQRLAALVNAPIAKRSTA